MKISVFGLGYVGVVSAACLADGGNEVVGVDVAEVKVNLVNEGKTPVIEKDIGRIIEENVAKGRLRATTDAAAAIRETEMSLICVGTPSLPNGDANLDYLRGVCAEIGQLLATKEERHIVVVRSTSFPGTTRNVCRPIIEEHSGKTAFEDFGLCFNPEFLREGSSVADYFDPPKIVVGSENEADARRVCEIYRGIDAPVFVAGLEAAEMVKFTDNCFHALKVCFANEIGNVCKAIGIDGHEVMEIFCADRKLNISPYYFKPGFAFGGSCLPKDVRALTHQASRHDVKVPLLDAIIPTNELQVKRGIEMIMATGARRIGVLGMSFKAGTDDLRESPVVTVIETLIGKGYDIRIYDRNVNLAKLFGANKEYIETRIRHISELMTPHIEQVIEFAETIVIGNRSTEFVHELPNLRADQTVVDLVRIAEEPETPARYEGICW